MGTEYFQHLFLSFVRIAENSVNYIPGYLFKIHAMTYCTLRKKRTSTDRGQTVIRQRQINTLTS